MGFLFTDFFWGLLLIILGLSIIIRVLFHIHIPVFRMVVAFILIYIGIQILMGGGFKWGEPKNTDFFNDSRIKIMHPGDYNVIFGRGEIDLTEIALNKRVNQVDLNIIFGAGNIRINPATPAMIIVNTAFADAKMPDGNEIHFGNFTYKSQTYQEGQDYLQVNVNTIFGGLEIDNKQ